MQRPWLTYKSYLAPIASLLGLLLVALLASRLVLNSAHTPPLIQQTDVQHPEKAITPRRPEATAQRSAESTGSSLTMGRATIPELPYESLPLPSIREWVTFKDDRISLKYPSNWTISPAYHGAPDEHCLTKYWILHPQEWIPSTNSTTTIGAIVIDSPGIASSLREPFTPPHKQVRTYDDANLGHGYFWSDSDRILFFSKFPQSTSRGSISVAMNADHKYLGIVALKDTTETFITLHILADYSRNDALDLLSVFLGLLSSLNITYTPSADEIEQCRA